ncbi:F0F1 ATP synthase subunit delta [Acinetobacter qingfengensis]|uniref:ATP synthase subunit delta n=1 Tax=Acinetobacter qingfengensis TaxID=1262585 RepID=A0A1E7RD69_9GAMM|nr:F0F1 ATP synthase subunit delta [Acinetobacter qingfengensis]KAA8732123.1 F0F1 ATP synthase subunit delta [Acinetobacter qingfengensis]OEY97202.1 F0F1 ATP synthase subunit delta [Acinetobacter qingfengensis]
MAELLTLARPYAKAAFAYASEQGAIDTWSKVLELLSATVQDEAFSAYIHRPELTPNEKVKAFVQVLGADQATVATSNFLTLLADNDRLALLPEISAEYELLKAQSNQTVDVVIESAFPLTADQEQTLANRLKQRFGSEQVNVTVEVKPELIAGVVIRAGDQVIDDSALNKLEKMRTRLLAQ